MVTVCLNCGNRGFEEALIYCYSCEVYAVHRYCLGSVTLNFNDYIIWYCEDCAPPSNSGTVNMEIDQTAKLGSIMKMKEKRKIPNLNEENKESKRGSSDILSRKDQRLEQATPVEHPEGCSEPISKIERETKRPHCLNRETSYKKTGLVRNELSVVPCDNPTRFRVPKHDTSAGKQSKLNSGGSIEESKCSKTRTCLGPKEDLSKLPHHSLVHRRPAARKSCEEAGSNRNRTSDGLTDKFLDIPKSNSSTRAQPIIEPIWRGSLRLGQVNFGSIDGLVAHLSSLACDRVCEAARSLPRRLSPELFPRLDIWPKSFLRNGGANDESIGLYFFPSSQSDEKIFDSLVKAMMSRDLAMRAVLDNAELLFFTSYTLPMQFWSKSQGSYFGKHPTAPP